MSTATMNGRIEVADIKAAASGRVINILTDVAGISHDLLDGKPHPCFKCGGTDRFRLVDTAAGAVRCNQCFTERCGDFIAAVQWATGQTFSESLRSIASYLGLSANGNGHSKPPGVLMKEFCKRKHIATESLKAYGARLDKRDGKEVVRVPMIDQDGRETGFQDFGLVGALSKGLTGKGCKAGMLAPGRLPQPDEVVVIVEGVKDACALHAMGFYAIGTPGTVFKPDWARAFRDCRVVTIPDRDKASYEHFGKTARRLAGVAANVSRVDLPFEMSENAGKDVRDLLQQPEGEQTLRSLIDAALAAGSDADVDDRNGERKITNAIAIPGDDGKEILVPLTMTEILERINAATDGWPRRFGKMLFVHDGQSADVHVLDDAAGLFGWLQSATGIVDWQRVRGSAGKPEVFAEVARTAKEYRSIEKLPHEPRIDNHYYMCEFPEPGDGAALGSLLDFFETETPLDRQMLRAAFATPLWGGPPGCRPAFMITAMAGRGRGKSKLAQLIGRLYLEHIDVSSQDDIGKIKTILLCPSAWPLRVAVLDNIKTNKFSWGELEALLTSNIISGHMMYEGHASRPNLLTWVLTLNGASLSTDMAQRIVEIRLASPKYRGDWEEAVTGHIDGNRQAILADLVAFLRRTAQPLAKFSRWATWESEVLSRIESPDEALDLILERRGKVDVEQEETEIVRDYFAGRLRSLGYDLEREDVFIPNDIAANWYNAATKEGKKTTGVTRTLNQYHDEGKLHEIKPHRIPGSGSRGFRWIGEYVSASDPTLYDLERRLFERAEKNGF